MDQMDNEPEQLKEKETYGPELRNFLQVMVFTNSLVEKDWMCVSESYWLLLVDFCLEGC